MICRIRPASNFPDLGSGCQRRVSQKSWVGTSEVWGLCSPCSGFLEAHLRENEHCPSLTVVGGSGRRPARLVAGGLESPAHRGGGARVRDSQAFVKLPLPMHQHPLSASPCPDPAPVHRKRLSHLEVWGTCPIPSVLVTCLAGHRWDALGLPSNPKLLQVFCTRQFSRVSIRLPV